MNIKNEVLIRVYSVVAMLFVAAILIFAQAFNIAIIQGEHWRSLGKQSYVQLRPVDAERGDILAADGSLLATSLPFFDIRFDLKADGLTDDVFNAHIDSLAHCLAMYVDQEYTPGGMREELLRLRAEGKRYHLIAKNVSYSMMEKMSKFPIFDRGRYGGGFIVERLPTRKRPYGMLANRTVGYNRQGADSVGLEGYFDKVLAGKKGKRLMQKVHGDHWIPVSDLSEIEPVVGADILTTLDVNLQDIAQEALLRGLNHHNADEGTAVIMEVKTGAIKAIANLGRRQNGEGWSEIYNIAVGRAMEPGSTFKLAPMMALLEDGYVDLFDKIPINMGEMEFYDEVMKDAAAESFTLDSATVKHAFEISSNVGIANLVFQHYRGQDKNGNIRAKRFVNHLKRMNLHTPTGIEIHGEALPFIKDPEKQEDDWSGTTLPWMSIGYELTLTPLQLLAFYNAVANDGMYMKPYLVSEIQQYGETIERIKPKVVGKRIASPETIRKAQDLLLAVVENGTADKLMTSQYRFAGKTGTAQINYQKLNKERDGVKYRASFVGYFPAQNPQYSCIVVVKNPRQNGFYGSEVAGPIFREIADKAYNLDSDLYEALNSKGKPRMKTRYLPSMQIGHTQDVQKVLAYLELPYKNENADTEMTAAIAEADTIRLKKRSVQDEMVVPNVVGMGLRDALYVLENKRLQVTIDGVGKVRRQSIRPGTASRGQTIKLTLN